MSDTVTIEGHRAEGRDKVTGAAWYAFEHPVPDAVYAYPLQAPIASGRIGAVDTAEALAMPGVITVLWGGNTNPFGTENFELALFERSEVTYRGQLVGAVIADTLENARAAAAAVRVDYVPDEHDVVLRADHPDQFRPEKINPALPTDFGYGDVIANLKVRNVNLQVLRNVRREAFDFDFTELKLEYSSVGFDANRLAQRFN